MTSEQFETLMGVLHDINNNIKRLAGPLDAKNRYDLSDVYSEINSVTSAVDSVKDAVDNVKEAVDGVRREVSELDR